MEWQAVCEVYIVSPEHDETVDDVFASRAAHEKTKPPSVMSFNKHKIGVIISQLLSYILFRGSL
jgi:hypothetical protein